MSVSRLDSDSVTWHNDRMSCAYVVPSTWGENKNLPRKPVKCPLGLNPIKIAPIPLAFLVTPLNSPWQINGGLKFGTNDSIYFGMTYCDVATNSSKKVQECVYYCVLAICTCIILGSCQDPISTVLPMNVYGASCFKQSGDVHTCCNSLRRNSQLLAWAF